MRKSYKRKNCLFCRCIAIVTALVLTIGCRQQGVGQQQGATLSALEKTIAAADSPVSALPVVQDEVSKIFHTNPPSGKSDIDSDRENKGSQTPQQTNDTAAKTAENPQNLANYTWQPAYSPANSLQNRIEPPKGYGREGVAAGSFAEWLRGFPLKSGFPSVKLYNGQLKSNQSAQYAVLDIDAGEGDLQQCADAVMRLRAEYLYAAKRYDAICFNYTNGFKAAYSQWQKGKRPLIKGNATTWEAKIIPDNTYKSFKKYLNNVFTYAGTYSLSKELRPVASIEDIKPGDVFIKGGFPGHAVIVMDVAIHAQTREKVFLLAQSYMPAQDIHLLQNPNDATLSPWYDTHFGQTLRTPEWSFAKNTLARFANP